MSKNTIRVIVLVLTVLFLYSTPSAGSYIFGRDDASHSYIPEPRLLSPVSEEVNLSGKDLIEFRWSPHEGDPIQRDYYDFRLYKGYVMMASTLIMKSKVDQNVYKIDVRSDQFENGQIYTWSLRQVYIGSDKSRRSYHSFKVIKAAK